jgi:hypothetical protein
MRNFGCGGAGFENLPELRSLEGSIGLVRGARMVAHRGHNRIENELWMEHD